MLISIALTKYLQYNMTKGGAYMSMLEKLWRLKKQIEDNEVLPSEHTAQESSSTSSTTIQPKELPKNQTTQRWNTPSSSSGSTEPVIPLTASDFNFFHFSHNSEKLQLMQFAQFLNTEMEERREKRTTEEDFSKDAEIHILIPKNKMSAFLTVLPPEGNGADVKATDIAMQVSMFQIQKLLDPTIFKKIEQNHSYLHVYQIAEGQPPVDGENGSIVEHFSRKQELHLQEDEHGNIDYRNLGIFQTITKGTPICDIIPPKEGIEGYDITGRTLAAKVGKPAEPPKGNHTVLSEDGLQLLAETDGNLLFEHNRFCIQEKLFISTDVDASVGNIDFPGDVEINGDVHNGFSITSGGSISIKGIVENAQIVAEKDVLIGNGMKGSVSGSVKAGGTVTSKFFENCTVYAKGNIYADSFLNCRLYTDQTIEASGIGIIIGCNITANSVHAKSIGNPSGHLTKIELSHSYLLTQDLTEKEKELSNILKIVSTLEPNIKYLSQLSKDLDEHKKALFQQLLLQRQLYAQKQQDLEATIADLKEQISGIQSCHIKAHTLFAPVQITAGSFVRHIDTTTKMCSIYLDEQTKEIILGVL